MPHRHPFAALLLVLLPVAACSGGLRAPAVTPEERAALEANAERFADDPDALTRIGIRFYQAGEYLRARDVLTASLGLRPAFSTAVYLGLAHEGLSRFDEAETSYRTARGLARGSAQREELERRLAALGRTRLATEARAAVAREAELSSLPPLPRSIAVLPWSFVGDNRRLEPLGRGLPQLILTDLGKIASLTLVERERVQALLDELALTDAGRIDSATAVRSGRLLRAAWVVAGVVRETPEGVQLETSVYRTRDAAREASGRAHDGVERLFAMQKSLVLDLVDQLGVPMTPAERRAVNERPTQDLQAFLAFSEGLSAQDRGDYPTAGGLFTLAAGRDPAFGAARQLGAANLFLLGAARSTPDALARVAYPASPANSDAGRAASLGSALRVLAPSLGAELDLRGRSPVRTPRLPEVLGQDNPSRIAIIGDVIIVIPRP